MLYSVNSTNFVVCWPFVLEILSNICMVILCLPVCEVINFKINVSILIKLFSQMTKKVRIKNGRTERTFKIKLKAFSIDFNELSFNQIKPTFLDSESEALKEIVQRILKLSYFSKRILQQRITKSLFQKQSPGCILKIFTKLARYICTGASF